MKNLFQYDLGVLKEKDQVCLRKYEAYQSENAHIEARAYT